VAIGLSLLAALVYGAADFLGGIASRKTPAETVVAVSQAAGFVVLLLALPFVPTHIRPADFAWGLASGLAGAVGIASLYAALAVGRMGVVSPITAVIAAAVPVLAGVGLGERPSLLAGGGILLAVIAIVLVTFDARSARFSWSEPGVKLALVSGISIGCLYVVLGRASHGSGLGLLIATRLASMSMLAFFAVAVRRESLRPVPGTLAPTLAAGALDMGANILYVLATQTGLMSIVAVVTSLYPASTVVLAAIVLGERLGPQQWAGVACAALGVALIAV
jgi:drug/metabolite transporter (DMT)-like permease